MKINQVWASKPLLSVDIEAGFISGQMLCATLFAVIWVHTVLLKNMHHVHTISTEFMKDFNIRFWPLYLCNTGPQY